MDQSLLSMFDLTRRAAIVTGASRGLGVSFARGLVKAGCDVALVARAPVAFLDPADTGETRLLARHGSLTPAEMYVPLVAWAKE